MREEIRRLREKNKLEIEDSIRKIASVLKGKVERLSVFGSFARKEHGLFSDLDILIVMKTDKPYLERIKELYSIIAPHVNCDVDVICYTPNEFERLKDSPFLKRVLAEEVVIYEKGKGRSPKVDNTGTD